jgi:dCTP deaminase
LTTAAAEAPPDDRPIPYGLLPDWAVKRYVPITPYAEGVKRPGVISYGQSSFGYDCRLGHRFKIFTNVWGAHIDPKAFDPKAFVEVDLGHAWECIGSSLAFRCTGCDARAAVTRPSDRLPDHELCPGKPNRVSIPPNSFALAESLEWFEIPADVLAVCLGKSTIARCASIVNVTPLEPLWKGKVTIEVSNTAPLPSWIYAHEGIMQILFLRAQAPPDVTYASKEGKYQNQVGCKLPEVD